MTENKFVEKTIARSGTMSRVYFVLHKHPEGLTIDQICEITGLKPSNVQIHGVKKLLDFNAIYTETHEGSPTFRLGNLK